MNDDQPTQPLTTPDFSRARNLWARAEDQRDDENAPYLDTIEALSYHVPDLLDEVDQLRAALTALGRNEQAAANRSLELQEENERLSLELAQMQSGAHIAMDAGVVALQEVKRLEKVCADLKEINDRMAEDRLRLVDARDQLAAKLEQRTTQWGVLCNLREQDAQEYRELKARMDQLRAEATGIALGHLAKIERLQSQRDALVRKLGLDWGPDEFGDLNGV